MAFHIGCGIILSQDNKYVLVQETAKYKRGLFNLPAGTLRVDEDLQTCAIRETEEETGFKPKLESFVGIYQTVLDNGNNVILFIFTAKASKEAVFSSDEHTVIKQLSYEELVSYYKSGKLRSEIVLKAVEDLRAGQKLPLEVLKTWKLNHLAAIASLSKGLDKG